MKRIYFLLFIFLNVSYSHVEYSDYSNAIAQVRLGGDLSYSEKIFLKNRSEKVKVKLEEFGAQINYVPRVAICASGGGYRAMISFLGFLIGLEKAGILDCATYISALSGSSWTLATWVCQNRSLLDLKNHLSLQTQTSITQLDLKQYKNIISNLLSKTIAMQSVGTTDIYGQALALKLLNGFEPNSKRLSHNRTKILHGDMFLPIYTAIIANINPYKWIEFTPFEVGSSFLNSYIPTWAFNRKFDKGISTTFEPEPQLDYLMGIFGSAFSVNIKDILNHAGSHLQNSSPNIYKFLKNYESHWISDIRIAGTKINNFAFGIPESPYNTNDSLTLADAGLDFNLPLPPLLERPVDIIIIFDASDNLNNRNELLYAQTYALQNNYNWPKINPKDLDKKSVSIFKGGNDCPTIIYMPLVNESGEYKNGYNWSNTDYAKTFNFKYATSEFEELLGLAEFNAIKAAPKILKTILEMAN
ncbi:hypothetical protein M1446_00465 [Candidatus Dependentiae bacterium]|nr:hypothetical protein [Candidatus Dependentiae bacterium]